MQRGVESFVLVYPSRPLKVDAKAPRMKSLQIITHSTNYYAEFVNLHDTCNRPQSGTLQAITPSIARWK